jgi:hypothetical protein
MAAKTQKYCTTLARQGCSLGDQRFIRLSLRSSLPMTQTLHADPLASAEPGRSHALLECSKILRHVSPRYRFQQSILGKLDPIGVDRLAPSGWRYIMMGAAKNAKAAFRCRCHSALCAFKAFSPLFCGRARYGLIATVWAAFSGS